MSVKSIWRVMAVLGALTSSAAQAQTTLDVTKITCEQFALGQVAPQDYLEIWLSGYYYGKHNNTTIEVEQLKENMNVIKRDCYYSKGNLMQEVERVLSQGK
ncbi:MAG TPA: HdeA/HdeB family chaperone [Xanthobacteraceae bacterium]|nr:HdeA/HdeB family chaperone [Xanthobacteraceae bacterium]